MKCKKCNSENEMEVLSKLTDPPIPFFRCVDCDYSFIERAVFHSLPVFHQRLIASKNGIVKDKRERSNSVQSMLDKTRVQTKGYTGEEAPNEFYSDSRDLYAEIVEMNGSFFF